MAVFTPKENDAMNPFYTLMRHPWGGRSLITLPLVGAMLLLALLAAAPDPSTAAAAPPPPSGTDGRLTAGPHAPGVPSHDSVTTPTQDFQDVSTTSSYYTFLHDIYTAGIVSGYDCGGSGEPCVPPE